MRRVALLAAVVLVAGGSMAARAGHQAGNVKHYTGCVAVRGTGAGTIAAVRRGTEPARQCLDRESLIHLSGGDITKVATPAAGGLQGGTSAGGASLSLTPGFRLPQGCDSSAPAPRWDGSAWQCAVDEITAAPGYALTEVDRAQFASAVALGSDGLPLVAYRSDGALKTAHCDNLTCTVSTVATHTAGGNPATISVAVGRDGFVLIAWYDGSSASLRVAHCEDVVCSTATVATLEDNAGGEIGYSPTVMLGTDGLGLISYGDVDNGTLKVAHCSNVACSAATFATVTSAGTNVDESAAAMGVDGRALIVFSEGGTADLRAVHCSDVACTSATTATIDSGGSVGTFPSVTLAADGFGLISYHDLTNGDLKVARCLNLVCNAASAATVDSAGLVGRDTSIALGGDGLAVVSYRDLTNQDLKVAHCMNITCSFATTATAASFGDVGISTSVTIGSDGLPLIASIDNTAVEMTVLHCSNPQCVPYIRQR